MTTLDTPNPDIEALLVRWVGETLEAFDVPVAADVWPDRPTWPGVKLQLLDDVARSGRTGWLRQAWVQLDLVGTEKLTLKEMCQTIISDLPGLIGYHPEGTVTDVRNAVRSLPDTGWTPPMPRYLVTLTVTYHPSP